jgi:hypothetical protein
MLIKEASIKTKKYIKKKTGWCQQTVDKRSENQKGKAYGVKNRLTKETSIKIKNTSKTDNQSKPKNG